jgi:PAS domain S-box-containing protein
MADNHKKLMTDLQTQFKPLLDNSPDGVYLWLDEDNMICNEKLAKMFGYKDAKEFSVTSPFLDKFVAEEDQQMFSENYQDHVARLSTPVTFKFTAVKKDGTKFHAETDMIPMTFEGHAVAYHFVREAKA